MFKKLMSRARLWWYGEIGLIANSIREEDAGKPAYENTTNLIPCPHVLETVSERLPGMVDAIPGEGVGRAGIKLTFPKQTKYSDGSSFEIQVRTNEETQRAFNELEAKKREEAWRAQHNDIMKSLNPEQASQS